MKYFNAGKYKLVDVKKEYKRLSKIHHPDTRTGTNKSFQELNNEYQQILLKFKQKAENKGNTEKSKQITKEIKTVSDLINKYVPENLQPVAKVVANKLGKLLINELNKRL